MSRNPRLPERAGSRGDGRRSAASTGHLEHPPHRGGDRRAADRRLPREGRVAPSGSVSYPGRRTTPAHVPVLVSPRRGSPAKYAAREDPGEAPGRARSRRTGLPPSDPVYRAGTPRRGPGASCRDAGDGPWRAGAAEPGLRPHRPGPSTRPERIYLHYLLLHLDRLSDHALDYLAHSVREEIAGATSSPVSTSPAIRAIRGPSRSTEDGVDLDPDALRPSAGRFPERRAGPGERVEDRVADHGEHPDEPRRDLGRERPRPVGPRGPDGPPGSPSQIWENQRSRSSFEYRLARPARVVWKGTAEARPLRKRRMNSQSSVT